MRKSVFYLLLAIIIITLVFSLSACQANRSLTSDLITYDGEYIKWEEIVGIEKYTVSINGGDPVEVAGTEVAYAASDTFTVKITTIPAHYFLGVSLGKELEVEKTFTFLSKVLDVGYSEGVITWKTVEGADSYKIQINSNVMGSDIIGNSYNIPDETTGQVAIRVLAQKTGGSFFSQWSETLNLYILPAPSDITFNAETQTISWSSVSQATEYNVIINNGDPIVTQSTNCSYNPNKTNFDIKIQAIGTNNIINSKVSSKVEYLYLAPITRFSVNDGKLSWEEIEHATSYKLKIKHQGAEAISTQNGRTYADLEPGKSYQVEVFPMTEGKNYFSSWSSTETINLLSIPANVKYEGNNHITWEGVNNATGYKVAFYKNGKLTNTETLSVEGNTGIDVNERFNEAAEYKVRVQADADTDQGTYYASKLSEPIIVIRLAKPASYSVTDNPLVPDSTNVKFDAVANASGYLVKYDDTTANTITSTSFKPLFDDSAKDELQAININIFSKGNITNHSSKKYVLDSLESLSFELQRLATPQELKVDNGNIKWNDVANNNGYVVYIDGSHISELTSRELKVPQISSGVHTITVKAKGNGSNVVSSALSNGYSVTKLATPQNVQVENKTVIWSQVNGCTGYKLSVSQGTISSSITQFALNPSDITTQGTIINVFALGNGSEIIDSDVSSSLTIRKLTAPTSTRLSLQGDNVVWNAPSNLNQSSTLYNLRVGQSNVQNGQNLTHASWNTGNLAIGDNSISIMAQGDGSQTFDSDYSSPTNIIKLAPMQINISQDKTKYEWTDVNNASSYTYRIGGGTTQTLSNSTKSWTPSFTVAKNEENIYFRAKGDYANKICDSDETTITLSIVALTTIGDDYITYDYDSENSKITVKISDSYTTGNSNQQFKYSTSGTEYTTGREFVYNFSGTPTITFSVRAIGGYFGASQAGKDMYYITSNRSNDKQISILACPTINIVKLVSGEYTISFGAATNAKGLDYQLEYYLPSGNLPQEIVTTSVKTITVKPEDIPEGATGFGIKAKFRGDDDEGIYDSKWSNVTKQYLD